MSHEASELINEAVEKQPKAGKKSRLRRWGRVFAVLFGLFVIWYLCVGRGVPPRISRETTWITEPRTADGKWIDYCKAYEQLYYPPEMQTDENGYRIIARHLGLHIGLPEFRLRYCDGKDYDLDQEALLAQGYEKLGLPPDNKPDMKFVTADNFILNYSKESHPDDNDAAFELQTELLHRLNQLRSEPWTLEQNPMMATWFEQTSPVLDLVSDAVAKPVFRMPFVIPEGTDSLQDPIAIMMNPIQDFRLFAREFQTRFFYYLGNGDIDKAIDDRIALHRLGRHVQFHGPLMCFYIGRAIDGMYMEGIADNLEIQPTAEQIRRFMQLLAELPPSMTVQEAKESERLFMLDSMQTFVRGVWPVSVPKQRIRSIFGLSYDWNIIFSRANQYISGELDAEAVTLPSFGDLMRALFISRKTRSEIFVNANAANMVIQYKTAEDVKQRSDCANNLQRVTLAMLLYHAEHGTLPPAYSLDANGKPQHSWRVLLLPYLGDAELAALYGQIHLDEAWDSEYNRQFHDQCPDVYRCPTHGLKPGDTAYCVITGDETPFSGGTGKSLSGFGPESGGMVLVAETRQSGNWMNPDFNVPFDEAKTGINGTPDAVNAIGSYHTGGANFGLRNGAVNFYSETIAPEVRERVLTGKEKIK